METADQPFAGCQMVGSSNSIYYMVEGIVCLMLQCTQLSKRKSRAGYFWAVLSKTVSDWTRVLHRIGRADKVLQRQPFFVLCDQP